jgi:hypothetical protein
MKKNILTNPSFRYIFEVFIIVFSVTVSFYIQEVINKKEKIELKNKALKGVLMELKSDVSNFNNASSILKARVRMGEEFLNGEVNNSKLNELMLTFSFTGQNSNYNSLVSTGVIEFIDNEALSKELVDYYERRYDMIQDMSEQVKKLYFEFLYFMKLNYPISYMDNIDDIENFQEWDTFMKVSKFNYSNKTLNKLKSDSIFKNHVYDMKRVILYYIKFYEEALLVNDNLSSLVNDELN